MKRGKEGEVLYLQSSQDPQNICRQHDAGDEIEAQAPDQLAVRGRRLVLNLEHWLTEIDRLLFHQCYTVFQFTV